MKAMCSLLLGLVGFMVAAPRAAAQVEDDQLQHGAEVFAERARSGRRVAQTIPDGSQSPSEIEAFRTLFRSIAHPMVPITEALGEDIDAPLIGDASLYAEMMVACGQGQFDKAFPGMKTINPETRAELVELLTLYAIYLSYEQESLPQPEQWREAARRNFVGEGLLDVVQCRFSSIGAGTKINDLLSRSPVGAMILDSTTPFRGANATLDRMLGYLTTWRGTPGMALSDLLLVFLLDEYPVSFGWHRLVRDPALRARMPAFGSPGEILLQKTTPSYAINQRSAGLLEEHRLALTWDKLGMNAYWGFGYTPVHAWLARTRFNHPVLVSFVPVIGSCLDAGDAYLDFVNGQNALGEPVSRWRSGALFAANYVFAVLDAPSYKALGLAGWRRMKQLRARLRTTRSIDEVTAVVADARQELIDTQLRNPDPNATIDFDPGRAAEDIQRVTGQPQDIAESLVNRALGHTVAGSRAYIEGMSASVYRAAQLLRNRLGYFVALDELATSARRLAKAAAEPGSYVGHGIARTQGRVGATGIAGKYEPFFPMLDEFARGGREVRVDEVMVYMRAHGLPINGINAPEIGFTRMRTGRLVTPEGQTFDYDLDLICAYTEGARDGRNALGWVVHRGMANTDEALEALDKHLIALAERAVLPTTPKNEAFELIAEMHWWEANLQRFERGSQGISDAMSRSLMVARGIRAGRPRRTISIDFEAFVRERDDFVANYHTFFERSARDRVAAVRDWVRETGVPALTRRYPGTLHWRTQLAISEAGDQITGYAVDEDTSGPPVTGMLPPWEEGEDPTGAVQLHIYIYEVVPSGMGDGPLADPDERLVGVVVAREPSPERLNERFRVRENDTDHGFVFDIPADLRDKPLRIYAVHPFFPESRQRIQGAATCPSLDRYYDPSLSDDDPEQGANMCTPQSGVRCHTCTDEETGCRYRYKVCQTIMSPPMCLPGYDAFCTCSTIDSPTPFNCTPDFGIPFCSC